MLKKDEIISIRERMGLTRKSFGELLGIPYETLTRWETGQREPSKVYEAKIRELDPKKYKNEKEHWFFLESNLTIVKKYIEKIRTDFFAPIYALTDSKNIFFLAIIRPQHIVTSMNDLNNIVPLPNSERKKRMQIVGCFISSDQTRPNDHFAMQILDILHTEYFVLYNKSNCELTVWRLMQKRSPYQDTRFLDPISFHILGETIIGN